MTLRSIAEQTRKSPAPSAVKITPSIAAGGFAAATTSCGPAQPPATKELANRMTRQKGEALRADIRFEPGDFAVWARAVDPGSSASFNESSDDMFDRKDA